MPKQLRDIPAIFVSLKKVDENELKQLFWGMEEEGIPYKTSASVSDDIRADAFQAASMSPLAVGIACHATEIVLQTRNLSPDTPLYQFKLHSLGDNDRLRHLGGNAARLVKGLPLKPL